jgi:hypothetical protein
VATIQAAFSQLSAGNGFGGPKLWAKPPDGRSSPELERAISLFQSKERINSTHRIEPNGPALQALDRALPQDWRGLAGIEGTGAVICTTCPSHALSDVVRVLRERTLLPRAAGEALGELAREIHRDTGLILRPDGHAIDAQGRLIQKLAFADSRWLAPGNRLDNAVPPAQVQQVLAALRRRPLRGDLEWMNGPVPHGVAAPLQSQKVGMSHPSGPGAFGPGGAFAARTRQGLRCLSGQPRPVDHARLARNHLQRTGDPVADRMLDVVTGEIEAGNAGANEIGLITGFFKGLFDAQANGIQQASQNTPSASEPETMKGILDRFRYSQDGPGDVRNWFAYSKNSDLLGLRNEAETVTREIFGRNGHNDEADAFRHAYWSFRMAQTKGTHVAKQVGDGHERRPISSYYDFSLNNSGQPPGELLMDLHNNHVGRELFVASKGKDDISAMKVRDIVLKAQLNNRLRNQPYKFGGR